MSMDKDDAVLARWRTERQPEPPDRWGRVAFWLLVCGGLGLAVQIGLGLFRMPPPSPPLPRLTPAQRLRIEQCREIGNQLNAVLAKAQENTIRQSAHPYLFEAKRIRLSLAMEECRKDVERMP